MFRFCFNAIFLFLPFFFCVFCLPVCSSWQIEKKNRENDEANYEEKKRDRFAHTMNGAASIRMSRYGSGSNCREKGIRSAASKTQATQRNATRNQKKKGCDKKRTGKMFVISNVVVEHVVTVSVCTRSILFVFLMLGVLGAICSRTCT